MHPAAQISQTKVHNSFRKLFHHRILGSNHNIPTSMATATETTATTAIVLQHIERAPGAEVGEDTIQTEVDYLFKDPKHEYEKPYDLKYDAGGIIPRTNMAAEPRSILIHNFRPLQHSQSFEYGFTSAKIDCALTASEFRNDETVKEVYYPAIKNLLWQAFPDAAEMQIIEHAASAISYSGRRFSQVLSAC